MRVPIALDDLRGNLRRLQAQARADFRFKLGRKVGECANRSRKFSDPQSLGRVLKTANIALHLRIPVRQLEAKRDRLGMNAMGAADLRSVLELPGAALEHFSEALQIFGNDVGRLAD